MKPLKFWAGERVIVGRRESGFCPVPVIKEVIRIDSDEEAQDKPAPARAMRKSQKDIKPVVQPLVPVMNIVTGKEETQRIVATPDMLNPRLIQSGDYKFQKTFSEGDFIAAGVIVLPKGSEKPNKNSNSSALVFYVISGEVQVQVHKTIFVVKTGSQFFVPRGNQYLIQNQTNREAKLFFCHGREIVVAPSEDPTSTK
ncbi:Mif2/CENP-C like-domain-containing protein [Phlyctochytrium arcticum]|nr:Mif2/CENP-C like-domain-containing protein [Phlyctochytrium arcticum]